jgi:hypothetical protein
MRLNAENVRGCDMSDVKIICGTDWKAWIDEEPPSKNVLHVKGTCTLPDGGYDVSLVKAVPQGVVPDELLLNIEVKKQGSSVPHHPSTYSPEYQEAGAHYKHVRIVPCNLVLPVKIIS